MFSLVARGEVLALEVRSGGNNTSGTWQESQTSEKKSLARSSVVESLVSLLLPSSDQSAGVGVFMGAW